MPETPQPDFTELEAKLSGVLAESTPAQSNATPDYDFSELDRALSALPKYEGAATGVMGRMTSPVMRQDEGTDQMLGSLRQSLRTGQLEALSLDPTTGQQRWVGPDYQPVQTYGEYTAVPTDAKRRREVRKDVLGEEKRISEKRKSDAEAIKASRALEILEGRNVATSFGTLGSLGGPAADLTAGLAAVMREPETGLAGATEAGLSNIYGSMQGQAAGLWAAGAKVLPKSWQEKVVKPVTDKLKKLYPELEGADPFTLMSAAAQDQGLRTNVNQMLRDEATDSLARILLEDFSAEAPANLPLMAVSGALGKAASQFVPLAKLGGEAVKESIKRQVLRGAVTAFAQSAPEAIMEGGGTRTDVYRSLRSQGLNHADAERQADTAFGSVVAKNMALLMVTNQLGVTGQIGRAVAEAPVQNVISAAISKGMKKFTSDTSKIVFRPMTRKSLASKVIADRFKDAANDFTEEVMQTIFQEVENKKARGEDTTYFREIMDNPDVIRAGIVGALMSVAQGGAISATSKFEDVKQEARAQAEQILNQRMAKDTTPIESMVTNQGLIDQTLTGQQPTPQVTPEVTPEVKAQFEQDVAALGEIPTTPQEVPDATQIRQVPESSVGEYQQVGEGGLPAEAGSRNLPGELGQVEAEAQVQEVDPVEQAIIGQIAADTQTVLEKYRIVEGQVAPTINAAQRQGATPQEVAAGRQAQEQLRQAAAQRDSSLKRLQKQAEKSDRTGAGLQAADMFAKTREAIKRNTQSLRTNDVSQIIPATLDVAIALVQDLAAMGQRGVRAFVEQARQLFDRAQIAQIEKNFGSLEALYERAVADSQMEVQTSEGQKVTLTAPDLVAEANAAKSEANFAIEQLKEREMTSAARRDAIASVKQDLQRKLDTIASSEGQDVTQREATAPVQATETQGDIYGQKFVYLNSGITLGNVVQSIDAILKQAGKPTLSERLGITYDNPSTAELVRALKKAIAGLGAKVEDTTKKLVKKFGLETPVAQILAKLLHDYKPPKGIKFHGPKERKQTYITQANDALQDAIEGTDAAIAQAMPSFQMAAPVPVGAPTESVTRRFPSVLRKLGLNFVEIANRINSPGTRSQRSEEYKKTTRAINAFTAARERFTRIFSSAYEAMLDLALVDPARARLVQFMMGLSTLADGGKGRRLTMAEMQAMTAPGMWNEAAQKAYDTARDAADAASKAMIESVDVDLKLGLQEMDRLIQTQNVLMAKTSAALAAAEKVVNQAQSDLEADPGNADKGQALNRAVAAYRAARTAHEDAVRGMDELKTVREKKIETAKQLTEVFGNKAYWPLSRNGNYRYDVWADGADGKPIRLAMFLSDERFDRNDPGSAQRLQTFLGSQIALASLTNKNLRDAVLAGKHKWGDLETRFKGEEGDGEGMVRDLSDPTEAAASNLGMDALVLEHTLNNTSIAKKIGRHISDLDGEGTGSLAAIAEMVRTTNSADFAELHFRYRQGVPGWSMDPLMSMEAFMRWGSNFYANNMEGRNLDNSLKNLSQEGARARGGEYFADDWEAAIAAAKDAKNPLFNPIVSKILEAGFLYGLGGNPAFMLQQATQQGLLIRWYLRHYYGGEAPVVKALAQGNKIAGKLLGFKVIDLEGYTPAQLETHLNKVVTVEDMLPLAGGNPKLAAEMKVNVVSALLHATQSGSLSPQNFIEPDSKRLDAPATSTSGAALAARAGWQSTKNALSYVASKTEKLNRIATTAATAALATRYGTFGANDATGWSFNKTADPDEITLFANEVSDLLNIGGKRGQRPSYQMGTWTKIPMQFKRFMIEQAVIIHNVGMLDLQRAKAAKDTNIVKQWWAYTKPQITQGMATYLIAGTQAAMPVYAMAKVMGAVLSMIGMIWPDLEDEIERDYIDAVGRETQAMLKAAAERMGLSPDMSDRLSKRAWFAVVNGPLWNLVTGTNISSSLRPALVFAPPGAGPMETMGHLIMGPMLSRPFAVADAIRGNEPWHLALKGAMPNSLQNLVGGAVMATTGRTWTKKPIPVDWIDAAAKALGVTTTSLAMVMSKNAEKTESGTELGDLRKEIRKMGENFVERSDSFTLSETEKEELRKKITQYNIIARRRGEKTIKYRDVRPTKPGRMQKREDELFREAGVKNPRRK